MSPENKFDKGSRIAQLKREGSLLSQLAALTSPTAYATTYATHGIHPYPAKYIPQLPNLIIREHTNERNTILDPFCGSGTTLLEAALLGRKSVGIDSNPIATLISRAKTKGLSSDQLTIAKSFSAAIGDALRYRAPTVIPADKKLNLEHWFSKDSKQALGAIRYKIDLIADPAVRDLVACVFSRIIVWASNQESDTRYAAVEKDRTKAEIVEFFKKKLDATIELVREVSESEKFCRNTPRIITSDIRSVDSSGVLRASVDLVVTSPPYPNSFDYYLYHKWRMAWLGHDFRDAMHQEIGSRREHSSGKMDIDSYIEKMRDASRSIANMLKPSKLAYFLVGDAVIAGRHIDISEALDRVMIGLPFQRVADTKYNLQSVSRSFREKGSASHGGAISSEKMQHILVYERTGEKKAISARPQARASVEGVVAVSIDAAPKRGGVILIKSDDAGRHIHSMGRYPSKFIPEVPRWAIQKFSRPGDLVLDPFVGSGTTAVECVLSNRNALAVDFSRYACLLTRAKTSVLDRSQLVDMARCLEKEIRTSGFKRRKPMAIDMPMADFWFSEEALADILRIRSLIECVTENSYQEFFLAVLSTCIRPASFQDAGQIKVKRDPKKVALGAQDPVELFGAALKKNLSRKIEFLSLVNGKSEVQVVNASAEDARSYVGKKQKISLVVTSPPYINAMNYPMTHRLESFVLGMLDSESKIPHEAGYIGTERVWSESYKTKRSFAESFDQAKSLNEMLSQVFQGEPKRSFIAYEYFRRMREFLKEMAFILKPGSRLVLVAGRNTIKGVSIPTVEVLASMAKEFGFSIEQWFDYAIVKNALKFTRHDTSKMIDHDGVFVLVRE